MTETFVFCEHLVENLKIVDKQDLFLLNLKGSNSKKNLLLKNEMKESV